MTFKAKLEENSKLLHNPQLKALEEISVIVTRAIQEHSKSDGTYSCRAG